MLDIHHYHAWDPGCRGASTGPPDGNYTCGDAEAARETLARCAGWAGRFRAAMGEEGAMLASSEFSHRATFRPQPKCKPGARRRLASGTPTAQAS